MSPSPEFPPDVIGDELARQRLELRAKRLERVVAALRERERLRARDGRVPAPLRSAMGAFARELSDVRRQLDAAKTPRRATP